VSATRQESTNGVGRYAWVNGLDMYYEVHGSGEPLVVVPGGLMTIAMMGPIVPALAQRRQVIEVEPQAHGHTADIDRPLTYEQLADDTSVLIKHLGLERADVLGFSVGGGVALQIAIRHPEVVRKIVVISGTFRDDGVFPEIRALTSAFEPDLPILAANRDAYLAAAAKPDGWAPLVTKMRQLLSEEYDWSQGVAEIKAAELFGLLGGGTAASAMGAPTNAQLAVLPGTTEFGIIGRTDLLMPIIVSFLDAPMPDAG
jgi:pimeloyl-ACP methyl ester carboxylesterase